MPLWRSTSKILPLTTQQARGQLPEGVLGYWFLVNAVRIQKPFVINKQSLVYILT